MDEEMRNVAAGSPPPYSMDDKPTYSPNPRPPPPSGYFQSPPRGRGGYAPVPTYAPPPSGYAPAPPIMQQQSSNNVVVVGQPQAAPVHQVVRPAPRANTYVALTAVLMAICFCHGNLPAFVCLVPALICACAAEDHNSAGEYSSAKDCGSYALCCNIFSIVYYVLAGMAGVAIVIIYFTVGFSIFTGAVNDLDTPTPCVPTYDWTTGRYTIC